MAPRCLSSLLLGAALAAGTAIAQPRPTLSHDERFLSRSASDERLPAVRLGLEEGRSQSGINAIHQDRQGFMWFATANGFNKYDGDAFTVYKHDPGDPGSISNSGVYRLHEDRSGQLWLATYDGGLNRFDPRTERFARFLPDPEDSTSFTGWTGPVVILEARDGTIWIGTTNGLNRYDPQTGGFVRSRVRTGREPPSRSRCP